MILPGYLNPAVLPNLMGFESTQQRKNCHIKHYGYNGQPGAKPRSAADHHVLPQLTFKEKAPQGMEHVWSRQIVKM